MVAPMVHSLFCVVKVPSGILSCQRWISTPERANTGVAGGVTYCLAVRLPWVREGWASRRTGPGKGAVMAADWCWIKCPLLSFRGLHGSAQFCACWIMGADPRRRTATSCILPRVSSLTLSRLWWLYLAPLDTVAAILVLLFHWNKDWAASL